jgi:hypothetical protein
MSKRWLFGGAIVAVVAMMGYGVYEAADGSDERTPAEERLGRASEGSVVRSQDRGFGVQQPSQLQGAGGGRGQGRQLAGDVPYEVSSAAMSVSGVVDSLDGSEMLLLGDMGETTAVGLGRSSYWESLGVALQPGDAVVVVGHLEDGELEAQTLTMVATGQTVVLRDASGRPMWAGGGRWADPSLGLGQSS